jgi:hypothetical protein
LHVTHTTRPFNTRVRITPETASRPERIMKDLEQIKQLSAILEEEASSLRRLKFNEKQHDAGARNQMEVDGIDGSTTSLAEKIISPSQDIEIESDPPEYPSEAIDRRVEKLLAEMQDRCPDSSLGWKAKKVTIIWSVTRWS